MSLLISCWFLSFICLFSAVLLVGAGRCFQQYNFPRPQFCAVIVCMVQLCLGSFLCMCFSWKAGLSWNVSLPVTKAPSVFGGKGWSIEEAVAFWEVAFQWLPYGVTEGKLLCTDVCLVGFYLFVFLFVFLFLATPSLFLHFLLFLNFSLKKCALLQWALAVAPKADVRWWKGEEKVERESDPWVPPSRGHMALPLWGGREALMGGFCGDSLGRGLVAVEGPDPEFMGAQERTLAFTGLRSQAKRVSSHPPMCGQEEGKRGQTGRKEANWSGVAWATSSLPFFFSSPHRPPKARVGARPWRQVNNPAQARAVQRYLQLDRTAPQLGQCHSGRNKVAQAMK